MSHSAAHCVCICNLQEMKIMIPAAKIKRNLPKGEEWTNERMPVMIPTKHAIPKRILKTRVTILYAGDREKKCSQSKCKDDKKQMSFSQKLVLNKYN